jgi:hypothetical protein
MVLLQNSKLWARLAFALILTLASLRAYRYPEYSTDGFSYMANAVAMSGASVRVIHDTVYQDAKRGIPEPVFNHLTGNDPAEPLSESRSFRERAMDPYRFAEFLPCFAIRPAFNLLIYVLHFKLGVGLLRSIVILPVVSYWLMGWVAWVWIERYVAAAWASLLCATLLLVSPPVWELARSTTPDALSSLIVLLALFMLFEKRAILPGMILLMVSIYVRTDNAVLALIVLAFLYAAGFGVRLFEALVLAALAVASVFIINHFAGDYGAKVLYYRSFVEAPIAVGEIVPHFGIAEYLAALKLCLSGVLHGMYIPFLLMGVVGVLRRAPLPILAVATVTAVYTGAHLVIFPNPETRFFGPFFVAMGLALMSTLARAGSPPESELKVDVVEALQTSSVPSL